MIRINLLPPELRKTPASSVSAARGGGACLVVALFWAWIEFVRIPNAIDKRDELKDLHAKKKDDAQDADQLKKKISAAQQREKKFRELLSRKVYWAETLTQFADFIGKKGNWQYPYWVGCNSLSIVPASGRPGSGSGKQIEYRFQWNFQLIGPERDKMGTYLIDFFEELAQTEFWVENNFVGKPSDPYVGDSATEVDGLGWSISQMLPYVRSEEAKVEVVRGGG